MQSYKPPDGIECQWSRRGFMTRYWEITRITKTYQEAYAQADAEHRELFGHSRYKNWDSFHRSLRNYLKKG